MVGADPVTGTLITLGVKALGDALGGLFGGGSPPPVLKRSDKRALEAAGYDIRTRGRARGPVIVSPTGQVYRGRQELKDLRALVRSGYIGNRPPPGQNDPIPSSSAAWPYIIGSIYWGSKGPRRRPKVKRKKDYGGIPGKNVCGTDSQCEEWCADNPEQCKALERQYELRKSIDMARGPLPAPVPVRPDVVAIVQALPPWAKLMLGVLWPSELGDSDLPDGTMPQPLPLPKGPGQRPRIGRPVRTAWPPPDFQAPPRPRPPPIRLPRVRPRPELDTRVQTELETVRVTAQRVPEPARTPAPVRPVVRAPTRSPTPTPTRLPSWLSDPLALLAPALLRQPQSPAVPRRISLPLTPPQQAPLAYPLQVPTRVTADQCQCEQPKRKRRQCTNPVVRKTKRTRGGRRFVTTTRRIDCA